MNRLEAFSHNDTKDREVAKQFLEKNKWKGIQMGGQYDLDLEVYEFKRGCDVEMISYGMERVKQYNHFRIPYRKIKYWSGLSTFNDKNGKERINKYSNWYIDYIQFLNYDLNELLWYDWKLIKEFKDNKHFAKSLLKENFTERESSFITIPFESGLERIKHYKKTQYGEWLFIPHTTN